MARRGQRMGRGINSCMNIAGWNYLFTPNSAEAQEARLNCVDYWLGRTSGGPIKKSDYKEDDVPFFTPTNVGIIIAVIIAVYYFVIRK